MKDLWFIRHAESLANIGRATSTPREIPLSENGFAQAQALASVIDVRPDLIILSPYERSIQTAQPLLERYPNVQTETLNVQEFTYLSISRCRGTNQEERRPWVAEFWQRADPNYCDGDQAESFAEFLNRCERFTSAVREREFELAFVFTHDQFVKGVLWNELKLADEISNASMASFSKFMSSFSIPNAAILPVKIDDDGKFFFGMINSLQAGKYD
jgi:broad specificity phosphatase PhoE